MCGITGIWNLNGKELDKNSLQYFTDSISHRGPDGGGYELFHHKSLGLGHRRLSILDLSDAGRQPFSYLNRYHITYNGEVYNFLEIKKELEIRGYTFKTDTDTEVILAAYDAYGKDCILRFNGMWAFAIWDEISKELFLSRDRYGVKPLHYIFQSSHLFAFASETIAFKYLEGFQRRFNADNLSTALRSSHLIEAAGKTIFDDIQQLLPGHSITLSLDGGISITRWWNTADHLKIVSSTYENQVEEFKELFFDACKLRMRSDVTIASALSGGIDSSSVYCTLQQFKNTAKELRRLPGDWQRAFIATFPGTKMDERNYAEKVIDFTGGQAVYITPDYSNLIHDIEKSTRLMDAVTANPLIAISDIYKAMHKAGVTVSLDGHGADEYAFGYNSYALEAFYEALKVGDEKKSEEMAKILCGLSGNYNISNLMKQFEDNNRLSSKLKRSLKRIIGIKETSSTNHLSNHPWFKNEEINFSFDAFSNPFKGISKSLFDDFHYYSLPVNLRDFDRAAMQNSVEVRMPFMDYRLVNYMFSIPESSKLGGGYTKRIIRDAMKGVLPEDIRTRTLKIGIGSPIAEWMKGPMKEFVIDMIHSQKLEVFSFLNHQKIRTEVAERNRKGDWDNNSASQTWSIVNALIINE